MAAIFPPASKGGVPPGTGVVYGYVPTNAVVGEGPLYASSDCTTALTADQMNGLTSEPLAAVDLLGFSYNSAKVTNLGDALVVRFDSKVERSGDTMTGPLILYSGPVTGDLQAVTKVYVDTAVADLTSTITAAYTAADAALQAGLISDINSKVNRAGDVLSGFLTLHADPSSPQHAATKAYVDAHAGGGGGGGIPEAPSDGLTYGRKSSTWEQVLNLSGGTMTGTLTLVADPGLPMQAATKQYVDNTTGAVSTAKVAKGGDTMSGLLTLSADPVDPLQAATKQYVDARVTGGGPGVGGQLRLVSSTALQFVPYGGDKIIINGLTKTIPAAGIAGLANTNIRINGTGGQSLVASTLYYVYAFDNAGTITADYSTTGHVTSSTAGNVGIEIKSGDDTRSLIGLIRTGAGGIFVDSITQRFVRSWFNRAASNLRSFYTATRSTTSVSYVEINNQIRIEWVGFSSDVVMLSFSGASFMGSTPVSAEVWMTLAIDSTTAPEDVATYRTSYADANGASMAMNYVTLPAEGYHFATVLGKTSAGTMSVYAQSNAAGSRPTLQGMISAGAQ